MCFLCSMGSSLRQNHNYQHMEKRWFWFLWSPWLSGASPTHYYSHAATCWMETNPNKWTFPEIKLVIEPVLTDLLCMNIEKCLEVTGGLYKKTRAHNIINVLVSCSFDDSGNFGQIPLEHLLFNYVGIWLVGSIVWFDRLFSHALHSIALFFYNIETTLTEMSCDECAFRTECFHMLSVTYQKLPFSHVQYICSCVTSFFLSHVN